MCNRSMVPVEEDHQKKQLDVKLEKIHAVPAGTAQRPTMMETIFSKFQILTFYKITDLIHYNVFQVSTRLRNFPSRLVMWMETTKCGDHLPFYLRMASNPSYDLQPNTCQVHRYAHRPCLIIFQSKLHDRFP